MRFIDRILTFVAKCLYRLRYRVEVRGLDHVKKALNKDPKSVLFLSNHVAHMEPLMMITLLHKSFQPRPFVFDEVYKQPVIKQLSDHLRSISVPNFEKATNSYKKKYWDRILKQTSDDLNKGDNFLIYPSGQLKRTPDERLSGTSGGVSTFAKCKKSKSCACAHQWIMGI